MRQWLMTFATSSCDAQARRHIVLFLMILILYLFSYSYFVQLSDSSKPNHRCYHQRSCFLLSYSWLITVVLMPM